MVSFNPPTNTKFIFITGGVLSGLGKGIVSASVGRLIKSTGLNIIFIKCDGYLNIDPGTMRPTEHGEVFVQEDGGEVDMDFGHYERFLDINTKSSWNLTMGKIFNQILTNERKGKYLGQTVQLIPQTTNEIKNKIYKLSEKANIAVIEIGGTVGDIEIMLFLEAIRQIKNEYGSKNCLFMHLSFVPVLNGEHKTKPTQHSVRELLKAGIQPDIIICRTSEAVARRAKEKIAYFCNVLFENIIDDPDAETVYEVPLVFKSQGLDKIIKNNLDLKNTLEDITQIKQASITNNKSSNLSWAELIKNYKNPQQEITIAICGKYTSLHDSYISILEALNHCRAHLSVKINLKWIDTSNLNQQLIESLKEVNGVIVPGGFGTRGVEGKIIVIKYARENNLPFLGLCYGMQLAIVEFGRNVCGLNNANSTEIDAQTEHPVIDILQDQKEITEKGGTMRLGKFPAVLKEGTKVYEIYGQEQISERHRHRYEVNPKYLKLLEEKGIIFSGVSSDKKLVEFIELQNHPFFIGTQAHPEFKSRFENPAPLFVEFIKSCIKIKKEKA